MQNKTIAIFVRKPTVIATLFSYFIHMQQSTIYCFNSLSKNRSYKNNKTSVYKNAFTLIEIVIGMLVIWVWLIAVIGILQFATKLTNSTKSQIVAINLAREGVEHIYNIRDTNWKMFASKKDQCWLASRPNAGVTDCENISRITPEWLWNRSWAILSTMNTTDPYFFQGARILSWISSELHIASNNANTWIEWSDGRPFRMCLQWETWDHCSNFTSGTPEFQTKYGRYRRGIHIIWLYDKNDSIPWGILLNCENWDSAGCGTSDAKELRFCSRVDYIFDTIRTVELCSAITNFLE